ncbi:hypothetical protein KI688_006700 [Linnemannia hyalina]|uniref:F-box domain-containing protein n=1 Tax=Linnemannia hyalina TaxID=64524 RepID=A0A9P7XK47_9FUNG|nr:hypothetical protein KI688_006700 [Linnemannia hyalina]
MTAKRAYSAKLHPMDIPEIRNLVISNLSSTTNSRTNILSCSCVSKAWLQTCLPYLWYKLDLRKFNKHQLHLRYQGIINNAHLIRHLSLEHMQFYELHPHLQDCVLPYCRGLRRIEFTETWNSVDDSGVAKDRSDKDRLRLREWADIAALVQQNPGLQEFWIENSNVWTPPVAFWKALAEDIPALRSLQILRATVGQVGISSAGSNISYSVGGNTSNSSAAGSSNSSDGSEPEEDMILDLFLSICDRVEELHLDAVLFTGVKTERWINGPTFSHLQKLTYFGRSTMQFELFYKALDAPGLRELTWGSPYRAMVQPTIIALILTPEIVKRRLALEVLDLQEVMPFEDRELQLILMSLSRPLLALRVKDSGFGIQALEALLRPRPSWTQWGAGSGFAGELMACHGSTIHTLNLQGCITVTSAMAQRLLQSCPQLEVFAAWEIKAVDILHAQTENGAWYGREQIRPAWACRKLKQLEVFISVFTSLQEVWRQETTGQEYMTSPFESTTTSTATSSPFLSAAELEWSSNGLESSSSFLSMRAPSPPPPLLEAEQRLHRAVYRELAQLTGLEKLEIGKWRLATEYHQNPDEEQGLDLRLDSGLDALAGLTRLRELDFRNTPQYLGEQDVIWMAEHFCGMSESGGVGLRGRFSGNHNWHRKLEVLFKNVQQRGMSSVAKRS